MAANIESARLATQAASAAGLPTFASLFSGSLGATTAPPDNASATTPADAAAATVPGLSPSMLSSLPGAASAASLDGMRALVHVQTPVGAAGFGQDVAHQLVYLAKSGTQSAQLTLQPENLGPVSVSIQMNGLQASLAISASHEATRAALQSALPHLGQMFSQSGLQLMNAHVGAGSQQFQNAPGQQQGRPGAFGSTLPDAGGASPTVLAAPQIRPGTAIGLIDTFA